jgi:hypothetical protein
VQLRGGGVEIGIHVVREGEENKLRSVWMGQTDLLLHARLVRGARGAWFARSRNAGEGLDHDPEIDLGIFECLGERPVVDRNVAFGILPGDPVSESFLNEHAADAAAVTPIWEAPRRTDTNFVRGDNGEIEKHRFYRGLGNFSLPLKTHYDSSEQLNLVNEGTDPISYAFVYEKDAPGSACIRWSGRVAAGAMIDTWSASYFAKPGLRVFWIVPRAFTDQILPLNVSPAPAETERVIVGRSNTLSPEFEQTLVRDFAKASNRWTADRFFPAYAERVRALEPRG